MIVFYIVVLLFTLNVLLCIWKSENKKVSKMFF